MSSQMFSFSARHAVEVIRRLVSAGIGPQASFWSWITFPPVQSGQSRFKKRKRKTDSIIALGREKHLNASNIFTPGLNYCTVQQSVQLGFLFKQPASAFLSQLSCLSGRYSSDAVACKHNRLGLCLPAEQLNQQEIQSQSINWWNNFNHLKALSWRRKTLTNGVQLLHFLFACFRFVVFFPLLPFKLSARMQFGNLAAESTDICS